MPQHESKRNAFLPKPPAAEKDLLEWVAKSVERRCDGCGKRFMPETDGASYRFCNEWCRSLARHVQHNVRSGWSEI